MSWLGEGKYATHEEYVEPKPVLLKYINVTENEFRELFPKLKSYFNIFNIPFTSDVDFTENYLTSKLWRMNNLYTIINKDGERVKFRMNRAQCKVYAKYLIHPRLLILKSRQQGISTFWLLFFFDEAIFKGDLNIGLMAQGREEAETLFERVKLAWDTLDPNIKEQLQIEKNKDNASAISFSNNSTIFIRTSFRSATLQGLHISELGKIANKTPERAKETNTGTLQAIKSGLPVAIESTAEGDNMFKAKWDTAYNHKGPLAPKDFLAVFLSWLDDPDCVCSTPQTITQTVSDYFFRLEQETGRTITTEQRWFWVMQERELANSVDPNANDIYQEYPATPEEAFAAVRDGSYYAKLFIANVVSKGRIRHDLFDKNLPVDVVIDLGMNDKFSMGFWQTHKIHGGYEERLIHEYTNSGEGLEHYVNYMFRLEDEQGYKINMFYGPHDLAVRELGTGMSRKKRLHQLGVTRIKVLPRITVNSGIEAVRRMIPDLYIDESCTYIKSCMLNYTKEWDPHTQNWKDKPLHNDYSHGADMVRGRAVSLRQYARELKTDKDLSKRRKKASTEVIDGTCL